MTKSESSRAPSEGKKRASRGGTGTSEDKKNAKMGVDQFAKLSIGDGPVVDVSVGAKSGLKGGIPAPNAVPAPKSAGPGPDAAPKGDKPKRRRGGRDKSGDKGAAEEKKEPREGAANGAGEAADREPREGGKSRRSSRGRNKGGGGGGGGGSSAAASAPGSNGADVEVEVRHKVVEKGVSPRPIPSPKGSSGAGGAGEPAEPASAYVPPSRRSAAPSNDAKPADAAGGRRGVIPLPKGHVALEGAPAGEKKTSKRGKRRDAGGEHGGAETGGDGDGDGAGPAASSGASGDKPEKPPKKEKKSKKDKADDGSGVNRAVAQASGKEIRRHLESGNVDGAMHAFEDKARIGGVDGEAARALIQGLVRANHLHEALTVADYLRERKMKMPLRHFTQIVLALSQRASPMDALDLLTALEHSVNYESRAIHNYHFHFTKLIVQEFLEEALQTLDRVANAPAFGLQESGLAAMDVVIHPSHKGGQLSLNIPALGEELKRGLMKGDTVLLSRTGEAARSMGDAAEMPTGPRGGPIEMPTGPRGDSEGRALGRGGRAGGGWRADFEFEAEVSTMFPNLAVKLIGCSPQQAASVRGGGWRCDKLANRTSFIRQLNALQDMMEVKGGTSQRAGVDPAIRDILVAGWDGNKKDNDAIPDMCAAERHEHLNVIQRQKMIDQAMDLRAMSHMNKSQTDALEAALFQRVTLIQGPPGTGKTHTAVALVQMWLRSRTCPILCTSDSNIAVDNLVDGLSRAGVRVARIGRPEAVRQDLMQYMVESIAGIEPGCNWSKDQQYQAINGVLRRAEVICATCAGAGSDILERFSFQACLIDEATQATEPATVVPLTKGCSQVVLIGDQKQLPPTIISREADAAGLGHSLFERMLARGIRAYMLKVQYRMHPAIAAFPSKAFYKGELLSGTPPSARRAPMGFDWPVPAVPLAFVDVPDGYERSDGSSQTNPVEAQKIVNIVKKLVGGHDVLPADIGIVTPYAAQVRAIKRLLNGNQRERRTRFDAPPPPDSLEALEVSTVDGFQGREKEVIVFTCTRANPNGNVGFLADPRRVNVMLTRARRGLIVVGHIPTLRREPTVWGPWLAWAGENGLICGAAATDADSAARLATIGMSSLDEIGGRGAGEVMQMGALLSPMMGAWGEGGAAADEGPKLKERAFIPDAWDDSDDDDDDETEGGGVTTETESATVQGSTNSLAGLADGAWNSEDDEDDDDAAAA